METQPMASCPYCGYPIEVGEHAPDCPNRPAKQEEPESSRAEASESGAELEPFLEQAVFPPLEISPEDEREYGERSDDSAANRAVREVDRASFPNIRDSVRMFFSYYSERGIRDWKAHAEQEQRLRNQLRSERGFGPDDSIDWRVSRDIDAQVRETLGEPRQILFPREDLLRQIESELTAVQANSHITYNVDSDSLEKILASGRITPMTELPEPEREQHRKAGGELGAMFGADPEGYEERRAESERRMGIAAAEGEAKPVYAALTGGTKKGLELGAAPQYGDVVIALRDDAVGRRTVFTEGDSMNPAGVIPALQEKVRAAEPRSIERRQLNRKNAELALALNTVSERLEEPYRTVDETRHDLAGHVRYIEAQVLGGVKMSDVESITITRWDFPEDLEWYKKTYPQYAEKFRLAELETESERVASTGSETGDR